MVQQGEHAALNGVWSLGDGIGNLSDILAQVLAESNLVERGAVEQLDAVPTVPTIRETGSREGTAAGGGSGHNMEDGGSRQLEVDEETPGLVARKEASERFPSYKTVMAEKIVGHIGREREKEMPAAAGARWGAGALWR
jgi:hypothetical protein